MITISLYINSILRLLLNVGSDFYICELKIIALSLRLYSQHIFILNREKETEKNIRSGKTDSYKFYSQFSSGESNGG